MRGIVRILEIIIGTKDKVQSTNGDEEGTKEKGERRKEKGERIKDKGKSRKTDKKPCGLLPEMQFLPRHINIF